jgi:hypothetical protein
VHPGLHCGHDLCRDLDRALEGDEERSDRGQVEALAAFGPGVARGSGDRVDVELQQVLSQGLGALVELLVVGGGIEDLDVQLGSDDDSCG